MTASIHHAIMQLHVWAEKGRPGDASINAMSPNPAYPRGFSAATTRMAEETSQILGIFLAEFDNHVGPKICFQHPQAVISTEEFDAVSEYVIAPSPLWGELVTVCTGKMKFVGVPICVHGDQYERNRLLFNVCFVFRQHVATTKFSCCIKKINESLAVLEKECSYMSRPETREILHGVLPAILDALNSAKGVATVALHESFVLSLVVAKERGSIQLQIADYEVPALLRDISKAEVESWDLTVLKVVPYVDGIRSVVGIAHDCMIEVGDVKESLRFLADIGIICMIDMFQFSNEYRLTNRFFEVFGDPNLRTSAINFVFTDMEAYRADCVKDGSEISRIVTLKDISVPQGPLNVYERLLLRCLGAFAPGTRVSDIALGNSRAGAISHYIDIRRLVIWGRVYGVLERVRRYPMILERSSLGGEMIVDPDNFLGKLIPLMDGKHSVDEICCLLGILPTELEAAVEHIPSFCMLCK
jgi:nitrogen permease regulator 2-like protein